MSNMIMRKFFSIACVLSFAVLCANVHAKNKTMYHYVAYDAAFWPKSLPVTVDNYTKIHLESIGSIPFDVLVFAPTFGFGYMAANLTSATYPKGQPNAQSRWLQAYRNGMPEMIKRGGDPITETVKWCRKNKKEAVVALPVNMLGVHSSKPTTEYPPGSWNCYLWPDFKTQNADCLMNPDGKTSTPFSNRFSVDYANAKVRDKFTAIAAEIASKYDIDGIMVDFMMNPTLFGTVAQGGEAAPKERELITQMMLKIKGACKAASARLNHPVRFSARVPDSFDYCKAIGIDLAGWFETKLLDEVVLGGSFQLNRWNVCGDAATKAGIPYYASFVVSGIYVGNDSGYVGDDERLPRQSAPTYRARIADAILCGASGCMYTMAMHHEHGIPRNAIVRFDPETNAKGSKRYFVSYTNDRSCGGFLKGGRGFLAVPSLLSNYAVDLSKGGAKYNVYVWDDPSTFKRGNTKVKTTLVTEASVPSGIETIVMFNGKEYKPFKKRAGTQLYDIPPEFVKHGANEVIVKSKGANRRGQKASLGNISVEVDFIKETGK
jgi:hypothetical protein